MINFGRKSKHPTFILASYGAESLRHSFPTLNANTRHLFLASYGAECLRDSFPTVNANTQHLFLASFGAECFCHSFPTLNANTRHSFLAPYGADYVCAIDFIIGFCYIYVERNSFTKRMQQHEKNRQKKKKKKKKNCSCWGAPYIQDFTVRTRNRAPRHIMNFHPKLWILRESIMNFDYQMLGGLHSKSFFMFVFSFKGPE